MNPKHLRERFPYMFSGENIGISVARGWLPTFEELCEDIDMLLGPDKRGFHWVQVKEKFGSARFYWELAEGASGTYMDLLGPQTVTTAWVPAASAGKHEEATSLAERIRSLVDQAARATQFMCIACSAPATVDPGADWQLVLCDTHTAQRHAKKLAPFWFEEDEQ